MNRLILLVESRIRGDVYVRFGGEHQKTHRSNTAGRPVISLPYRLGINWIDKTPGNVDFFGCFHLFMYCFKQNIIFFTL